MIGGKNLRKFRPGRGLGKEGAGGLKRRSDHSQWKPEGGCQQESDNPPSLHPPALERYSCSSFGEWVGLAGHGGTWRTQRAKRDRPGGRLPFQGVKGRHLWPRLPGLINSLHPGHSVSSGTGPPEMGVGEEPHTSAVTASGNRLLQGGTGFIQR